MRRILIFLIALSLCISLPVITYAQRRPANIAAHSVQLSPRQLVRRLQRGGYVLYIRHGERDAFKEPDLPDMNDCKTQDNLTAKGRAQSVALGADFKALKIPVGEVYTGQFCRNKESAALAFGKDTVLAQLNRFDKNITPTIRRLLATRPPDGSNTIIVNHHQALADATHAKLLVYAESAVFLPDGKGSFRLIGYIGLDALDKLKSSRSH